MSSEFIANTVRRHYIPSHTLSVEVLSDKFAPLSMHGNSSVNIQIRENTNSTCVTLLCCGNIFVALPSIEEDYWHSSPS